MRNWHKTIGFAVLAALAMGAPAYADGGKGKDVSPNVAAPPIERPTRASPQNGARPAPAPNPQPAAAAPPPEPVPAIGRTGEIALANGAVSINVPAGYYYYNAAQARGFLDRNNAAHPAGEILGLVAPAGTRIDDPGAWGAVISYDTLGYVSASTAGGLSADNFEDDVASVRASQNRVFEGFAVPPAFDPTSANLSWAERAAPPGAGGSDLRHEQRILGRDDVTALTTIGSADQQGQIVTAAPDLSAMVSFPDGQTYGDFEQASDAASVFTLPSLVTGVAPAEASLVAENANGENGGGLAGLFPWIAIGIAALAGLGYVATRGRAKREAEANLAPEEE